MSSLGIGVILNRLSDNSESVEVFKSCIGKVLSELSLGEDDALHFKFVDGTRLKIYDDGQSCCEYRYMRTDDELSYFVGAELMDGEVKDAPNIQDEDGEHEVQFLVIKTSKGEFTMANHNEHNGCYGGFSINCTLETDS